MPSIYQIRKEIADFEFELDPETGEILNSISWDELNMAYEEKVENIACFIKNLNGDIAAFKAEEENLAKRRNATERKVESLKKLLVNNMDGQKFSSTKCAIGFRNTPAVEVLDENAIPPELMTEKVTISPDKNAIKELLKNGTAVPGCELRINTSVQIK